MRTNDDGAVEVWVAEVGVQDTECYAEGTETTITVHATRDGAARSVREQFLKGSPGASLDLIDTAGASGEVTEDSDGFMSVPTDDADEDNIRFKWSWALYQKPVLD